MYLVSIILHDQNFGILQNKLRSQRGKILSSSLLVLFVVLAIFPWEHEMAVKGLRV